VRQRKTDYGTVILHWLLVIAIVVAFMTGLRIATETPERTWINAIDILIPNQRVWTTHMQSAVVLVGVSVAYAVYVIRSGLARRVQLDKMRLRGLWRRGSARRGAINILLYWLFFISMGALIVTGGLMYFGYSSGTDVLMLHWYASWIIPGFVSLHVLTHYAVGGVSQLMRICRPTRLITPPPPLDAVELLTLLVEQKSMNEAQQQFQQPAEQAGPDRTRRREPARPPPAPQPRPRPAPAAGQGRDPRRQRNLTIQSNPFVVAAAVAIVGATFIVTMDQEAVDTLHIHRINSADAPVLDGETSDPVWRTIAPFSVMTSHGGNFDGKGETKIDIRAAHDGTWAYFLFTWADPTRSLKRLPLVKADDGWRLLHNGYEIGDEQDFEEDKFSVLLTKSNGILAGDNTFHAGPHPISEEPATLSGRGLHYTENGGYADVWLWKATSSASGWMDDSHFGPPAEATPTQVRGVAPYRGGFEPDPGTANYSDNFSFIDEVTGEMNQSIRPLRLPKNPEATRTGLGLIDLNPDHGESDGARWFMTEADSQPYTRELDSQLPRGTIVPSVIISADGFTGDRADVRCAARWASGTWALEVARRLDTHSKYDVPIATGTFMRVAAFDHSQIRHTRLVRPIHLEVE
jgi:Ethylbenzene dehydrogenase/Prokaryotic cytochrome b561